MAILTLNKSKYLHSWEEIRKSEIGAPKKMWKQPEEWRLIIDSNMSNQAGPIQLIMRRLLKKCLTSLGKKTSTTWCQTPLLRPKGGTGREVGGGNNDNASSHGFDRQLIYQLICKSCEEAGTTIFGMPVNLFTLLSCTKFSIGNSNNFPGKQNKK